MSSAFKSLQFVHFEILFNPTMGTRPGCCKYFYGSHLKIPPSDRNKKTVGSKIVAILAVVKHE